MSLSEKELVEGLRVQWKRLWAERAEDKVRAEGIAVADYCDLYVEKGTVIHATRDFKTPSFKEILEQHQIANIDRVLPLDPHVGGWTKFIKANISSRKPQRKRRADLFREEKRGEKQPKKGGRGWLHL
jgi:hypothetical protein